MHIDFDVDPAAAFERRRVHRHPGNAAPAVALEVRDEARVIDEEKGQELLESELCGKKNAAFTEPGFHLSAKPSTG